MRHYGKCIQMQQKDSRKYPAQPQLGISVMCWKKDQVLLIKRGQEPFKGQWSLPGGLVHLGETMAEAAVRELQEETCIHAEIKKQLETFDSILRDDSGKSKYHYVLVVFEAKYLSGIENARDDASEVEWYTITQLENLALTPNTKRRIEKYKPVNSSES